MSHVVSEWVKLNSVLAIFRTACIARSFGCPRCSYQMFTPATAMAVVGIAGVAVAVAAASSGVVVGTAKDVVDMKVEAALIAQPLIRCAPRAEAVVRSNGRPGAAVYITMMNSP